MIIHARRFPSASMLITISQQARSTFRHMFRRVLPRRNVFYDLTRDSPYVKTKRSCCAYNKLTRQLGVTHAGRQNLLTGAPFLHPGEPSHRTSLGVGSDGGLRHHSVAFVHLLKGVSIDGHIPSMASPLRIASCSAFVGRLRGPRPSAPDAPCSCAESVRLRRAWSPG